MTSILFGSNEGIEFGPPREKRSMRAFALAILAHLLLLGALTWGVNWKRSDPASSFEAELWSAVPQQAAPRAVEPPPPPPAPTPPAPTPPAPKPAPEPPKESPKAPDVDIALEQEKKRKLLEKQKEAEAKKLEERENREKAELQVKKEKELKAKEDLAKRKAADEAKKAEAKQDAKDLEKLQQQKQADAAEKRRQENLARMNAQLGTTGDPTATGNAQKSTGLSASYSAKVADKIESNMIFNDDIAGNPRALVEVTTSPDGRILGQRLVRSSGNKLWDDAVIKGIIRTETLPRNEDGKVPSPMEVGLRPKKEAR
jgi:colicin import membrane protein